MISGTSAQLKTRMLSIVVLAFAALVLSFTSDAQAASLASCSNPNGVPALTPLQLLPPGLSYSSGPQARGFGAVEKDRDGDRDHDDAIVGLWYTVYKTHDGKMWDIGFQQYHAGGTELSVDNAVPPAMGNVCVGVWKKDGTRTFKLRHYTWNWNPDGTLAGIFLLLTTVQLDARGNVFEGRFVSESFDLHRNPIPELHAEGTLRATRITVD